MFLNLRVGLSLYGLPKRASREETVVEAFQIFLEQHFGESLEALLHAEDEAQHYPLIVE